MLEQLKQAVACISNALENNINAKIRDYDWAFKEALNTCQLMLESSGLVEDKPKPDAKFYKERVDYFYALGEWSAHNACNEANRIARAKWLLEKISSIEKEIVNSGLVHMCFSSVDDCSKELNELIKNIEKKIKE